MTQRITLTERALYGLPEVGGKPAPEKPVKRRRVAVQHEHVQQVALFRWASEMALALPALRWMFAIPNGGQRHPAVAKKLKAEGVRAGVPDICLPHAARGYHGLYIELKAEKGRESERQNEWRDYLTSAGYLSVVRHGWHAASVTLEWYLGMRKEDR